MGTEKNERDGLLRIVTIEEPAQIRLSELEDVAGRAKTGAAVLDAAAAWARAPSSIKLMAGAYVAPLMAAIIAINDELQGLKNGR